MVNKYSYIFDENASKGLLTLLLRDTTLINKYKLKPSDFEHEEWIGYQKDKNGDIIDINGSPIIKDECETENDFNMRLSEEGKKLYLNYVEVFKVIENNHTAKKKVCSTSDAWWGKHVADKWHAIDSNLDYYYETVRKTTILREGARAGSVLESYIYHDNPKMKTKEKENFSSVSAEELRIMLGENIGKIYLEQNYGCSDNKWPSDETNAKEYTEEFFTSNPWGQTTMSPMLNTLIHGWCPNCFYEIIASSGCGKSMASFSNLTYGFAPKIYNAEENKWIDTGVKEKALYIGTEMDLKIKCVPQIVCCMANLNWNRISVNDVRDEEKERFENAVDGLLASKNILMEHCPDYDIKSLEQLVNNYIQEYKISTVFLDYMEVTDSMEKDTKKQPAELLNDLAKACKNNLASKGIAVVAFAQANSNIESKPLFELDGSCVKTSHTLHLKADTTLFMVEGTDNDMDCLTKANGGVDFIRKFFDEYRDMGIYKGAFGSREIDPRRIRKILVGDKNRADSSKRGLCVWCFVENGTLRWHDLFVTDNCYRLQDIKPTVLPFQSEGEN